MVTSEQLEIAAKWLDHNEGDDVEAAACAAAASFLRRTIKKREIDALADKLGREIGCGPALVRRTDTFKRAVAAMRSD